MWRLKPREWPPYLRYLWLRVRRPRVRLDGVAYLGARVDIVAKRGHGRLRLGSNCRVGNDSAIRAHEGSVHIGDKTVLGARVTVNAYLDVVIGASTLIADDVYIIDFDHRTGDVSVPIMDQGIVKAPVRIGRDCWLGTKVVVTPGVRIGDGAVVAAAAVVTKDVEPYSIVAGVPAAVIGHRDRGVAVKTP